MPTVDSKSYLTAIRDESDRLAELARQDLGAVVPSCPEWTVRTLVEHVAVVYLHKAACTRLQANPKPWPPETPPGDPVDWLVSARDDMLDLFASLGPEAPSATWEPDDQTVGFWLRRMSFESTVHRVDVELALDARTPVSSALAPDGIDEVLDIVLAGDWSDSPQPGASHQVRLRAGSRVWLVSLSTEAVTVDHEPGPAGSDEGLVLGTAEDLLLWLWRRPPLGTVSTEGNPAAVTRLRDWLAVATA
jgi:uncharacterized protein (TIGR03083 family)